VLLTAAKEASELVAAEVLAESAQTSAAVAAEVSETGTPAKAGSLEDQEPTDKQS
jgi:peptide/nickel transport system ATP-binding protein